MKTGRILYKICGAILMFVFMGTFVEGQTIHLVTVGDFRGFTKPVAEGVKKDLARIEGFFRDNVPTKSLKIYQVDGNMATPDAICETISQVAPNSDDTFVFYYSGHAANAAELGGQYFQLSDTKGNPATLRRSKVRGLMIGKNVRLVVLLTDCCNAFEPQELDKDIVRYANGNPAECSPVIVTLFLKPRGVADLTSSKFGQSSIAGESGSIATFAWVKTFEDLNKQLTSEPDKQISWRDTIQEFCVSANKIFKAKYPNGTHNQTTQVPHAYEYPAEPRFGVRTTTLPIGNVYVSEIMPDSPGAAAGLKKGDIITKINGEEVLDEPAYSRMIDISPRKATVTYKRDGKEQTVNVELKGFPEKPLDEPTTVATRNPDGSASLDPAVYGNQNQGQNQNQNQTQAQAPAQGQTQQGQAPAQGPVFGASVQGNKFVKIVANSPASRAGLQVGDTLVSMNGTTIQSAETFSDAVDQSPVAATCIIIKSGSATRTQVTVYLNKVSSSGSQQNPQASQQPPQASQQNPQASQQNPQASQQNPQAGSQQPPVFGAEVKLNRIEKITPGSPAEKAGLEVGDLILKFNGMEIKVAEDYERAVDASPATATLVIRDQRTGQDKTVNINLAK